MSISEVMILRSSGEYDLEVVVNLKLEKLRIRTITNLDKCSSLIDLSLANNEIMSLSGLDTLVNLRRLNLSFNRIRRLDGLDLVSALEWLNLKANSISNIDEISVLSKNPRLTSLFLRDPDGGDSNSVCDHPAYKTIIMRTLPNLQLLDGGLVGLIDATNQLEKHLEGLKPQVDDSISKAPLDNWFEGTSRGNVGTDDTDGIDQEYALQSCPSIKQTAEKIEDMLKEESTYLFRLATAAVNKAKAPHTE